MKGRCPQCGGVSSLDPGNAFRPFCTERCKLLDLGDWMSGKFAIPVAPVDDEDGTPAAQVPGQDPRRLQ